MSNSWFERNDVDEGHYFREKSLSKSNPRYLKSMVGDIDMKTITVNEIDREKWELNGLQVFALPSSFSLSKISSYRNASIQAIDLASIFAAYCLDVKPGDNVLDLCCAPCGKFMVLAELMKYKGCLVGIDNCKSRVSLACNILRKYRICDDKQDWDCFLLLGDARNASIQSMKECWSTRLDKELCENSKTYINRPSKRKKSGEIGIETKTLSRSCRRYIENLQEKATEIEKLKNVKDFDRVLVDVECSTDGSFRSSSFLNLTEEEELELQDLQRQILLNGFALLKEGGLLVYSTCSFSRKQNEDIINWLLEQPGVEASVVNIREESPGLPCRENKLLEGSIQFMPSVSKTSALYVCKLRKGISMCLQ